MDIEGLGEKNALRFLEEGLISDAADIYDLTAERVERARGLRRDLGREPDRGDRGLEEAAVRARAVRARACPGVGYVNAEALAEHFGTMDALLAAQPEQIEEVEGIGPILAEQIVEELAEERDLELIERLREAGLRMELDPSERRVEGGPLDGKTLVLTGTLPELTREEATQADQARRRQGRQLGLEEDRLRRRRRQPRLEARQGRGAGHRGARRERACASSSAEARDMRRLASYSPIRR